MAEHFLIIAIILSIAIAVAAYRIINGVLKLAVIAVAVAGIVLGVAAFLVIMDANDFRENLGSGKSLVVVVDETKALFAMEIGGESDPKIINRQQLEEYSEIIGRKDYRAARGDYYKLIVIGTGILEKNETVNEYDYSEESADFFVHFVERALSDPVFFASEYKKGEIRVYDETALFKALRIMPIGLVKSVAEKAMGKVKTKAVDKIEG